MYAQGARTFVEVGPSSVLTGLIGAILGERDHRAIAMDSRNKSGLGAFLGGIGDLVAAGVPIDFEPLWAEYGPPGAQPDGGKPAFTIPINGANYGKPYPGDLAELVGPNLPDPAPVAPAPSAVAPARSAVAPASAAAAPDRSAAAPVAAPVDVRAVPPARPAAPAFPAAVPPAVPTRWEPAVSEQAEPQVPPSGPSNDVLAAYQAVQYQTAQAHTAYLNTVAQAHGAFLQTAQQSLAAVGALAGAETPDGAAHVVAPRPEIAPPMVAPPAPPLAPPAAAVPPPAPPAPPTPEPIVTSGACWRERFGEGRGERVGPGGHSPNGCSGRRFRRRVRRWRR